MGAMLFTLLSVMVLLIGTSLMTQTSLKSALTLTGSWEQMEAQTSEAARTNLAIIATARPAGDVEVTLRNIGQTAVQDFASWDVIVEYYTEGGAYYQKRLVYTSGDPPDDDQWRVKGLYLDAATATSEVFRPRLLDPGEEVVLTLKLNPQARTTAANLVVVSTGNGIATSGTF